MVVAGEHRSTAGTRAAPLVACGSCSELQAPTTTGLEIRREHAWWWPTGRRELQIGREHAWWCSECMARAVVVVAVITARVVAGGSGGRRQRKHRCASPLDRTPPLERVGGARLGPGSARTAESGILSGPGPNFMAAQSKISHMLEPGSARTAESGILSGPGPNFMVAQSKTGHRLFTGN